MPTSRPPKLDEFDSQWSIVGEGFRWHDLRHQAATALIRAGVHIAVVGTILGHRDLQTTSHYAHIPTDQQGEALRKVNN